MVPVNMAIIIKALPTFILIIHCHLGTFGVPNLIHMLRACGEKCKYNPQKETLWHELKEETYIFVHGLIATLVMLLFFICLPADAINVWK